VPGKSLSVVEFFRSGQEEIKTRPRPEKKSWNREMKFSGSLIENLMATVERAEQRAQSDEALFGEALAIETMGVERWLGEASLAGRSLADPWFASAQANADYDMKLLGVA
jgi:hypothetical protein